MNETEARMVLEQELAMYRERSYAELLSLINRSKTIERTSSTGIVYQIEVQVFFDDEAGRTLRVMGAIDDGRRRASRPLCSDFIVSPDGAFVGE